jgi:hypothetical protein
MATGAQSSLPAVSTTGTDTTGWVHHQSRIFGVQDILLPPMHQIRTVGHTIMHGDIIQLSGKFEIELLYNSTQVQNRLEMLRNLAGHAQTPLLEPVAPKSFSVPGPVSFDCVLATNVDTNTGPQHHIYKAILQSPYTHGLTLSSFAAPANLTVAKGVLQAMARSLVWANRSSISRDLTTSFAGSKWRYYYSHTSGGSGVISSSGSLRETREYKFLAGGRFAFDRSSSVSTSTSDSHGNVTANGSVFNPDHVKGLYQVFEYENGVSHLVLTEEGSRDVKILAAERRPGVMTVDGKKFFEV